MNPKASMASGISGHGSTFPTLQHGEGLTTVGGALAVVSTIIGGGIVGLPFAIYLLGLAFGFSLNITVVYMTYLSGVLYLKTRELIPGTPNSLFEIGYILKGKASIYGVAIVMLMNSMGLILIYLIVFSTTAAQLVGGYFGAAFGEAWYSSKLVYLAALGLGLSPIIVKKELAELEWLSILLGVSIVLFVLLSLSMLLFDKSHDNPPLTPMILPKMEWESISGLCTVMVAYSY